MDKVRLQKYLSQAGVCSRRKGEEYIKAGRIQVNGHVVSKLGTKVDPDYDEILFNGKQVLHESTAIYIAMNKPVGIITSCKHGNERVVTDLVYIKERVYPVGRLDKDSEGLLLLVNDGNLHHKLSHPSFDHEKEYVVRLKNKITETGLKKLENGVLLSGKKTRKAYVKRVSQRSFVIVLKEGRNRQIRRMVGAIGNAVVSLKRVRMANVTLGNLKTGEWRYLTKEEIGLLKQMVQ